MSRARKMVDGELHVQCFSCKAFLPATKEFYFFQGKGGCRGPHSACKPCYSDNRGRSKGMMTASAIDETPPEVKHAAATFLRFPSVATAPLRGPAVHSNFAACAVQA